MFFITRIKMVYLKIKLPDETTKVANVTPDMTLRQILTSVGITLDNINIYNDGDTELNDLDRTMVDYNNWYVEKDYISSIYIKYK
jgi:hypothetical protein